MRTEQLTLTAFLLLAAATAAVAQTGPPPVADATQTGTAAQLSADQARELSAWLRSMKEWRAFDARWSNRPARDGWGRIVKERTPPAPPAWLPEFCTVSANENEETALACRLVEDPRAPAESLPGRREAERLAAERPPKRSRFFERLHIDGLWSTTAVNGRSYGIIGSHLTLVDVGRVQVFGPPGVLLLSVPDGKGSRRIELGYTWGVSVRLMDVRLFASRDMTLFLNLTKVWAGRGGQAYDIVGFSIAPRKAP